MATERPFGVVILVILEVLGALGFLGLGGILVAGGGLFAMSDIPGFEFVAGIILGIGAFLLLLGIISLIIAWGLWTGQGWAWIVTLIFAILGLIGGIIALIAVVGIIPVIINILILYYLTRPHVKAFFGKGPPPEAPPPPPP